MSAANIERPDFDDNRDAPGFTRGRARIGRQLCTEKVGLSLFEVPPWQAAYPYHWHLAEEELIVVLSGRPSLRTPDGWQELEEGDVVPFRVGEEGAHQLVNRTEAAVRFLSLSTNGDPQIVIYPDSDKLGAFGRGMRELYRRSDAVDYYEGESPAG